MKQFMLLEENQFDFDYMDATSVTYTPVELPEGVTVRSEITAEDLAFGIANSRPVLL